MLYWLAIKPPPPFHVGIYNEVWECLILRSLSVPIHYQLEIAGKKFDDSDNGDDDAGEDMDTD